MDRKCNQKENDAKIIRFTPVVLIPQPFLLTKFEARVYWSCEFLNLAGGHSIEPPGVTLHVFITPCAFQIWQDRAGGVFSLQKQARAGANRPPFAKLIPQ